MWPTVFHDRPKLKHPVLHTGPLVHYEFKFSQVQVSIFVCLFASVHSFSFLFFFSPLLSSVPFQAVSSSAVGGTAGWDKPMHGASLRLRQAGRTAVLQAFQGHLRLIWFWDSDSQVDSSAFSCRCPVCGTSAVPPCSSFRRSARMTD